MQTITTEDRLNAAINEIQQVAIQMKQEYNAEAAMWQRRIQALESENQELRFQLQKAAELQAQLSNELETTKSENERLKSVNNTVSRALQEKEAEIARHENLNHNLKNLLDQNLPSTNFDSNISFDSALPYSTPSYRAPTMQTTTSPYQLSSGRILAQTNTPTIPSYLTGITSTGINSNGFKSTSIPSTEISSPQYEFLTPTPANRATPYSKPYDIPESSKTPVLNENGKPTTQQLIRIAKQELTATQFNEMIQLINMYNKGQQTKEETRKNIQRIMLPSHRSLYDLFLMAIPL